MFAAVGNIFSIVAVNEVQRGMSIIFKKILMDMFTINWGHFSHFDQGSINSRLYLLCNMTDMIIVTVVKLKN